MRRLLSFLALVFLALSARAQPPDTLWSFQIGGPENDQLYSTVVMPDGRVIACGATDSYVPAAPYLVGLSPEGQRLFARTVPSANLTVSDAVMESDSTIVLVGDRAIDSLCYECISLARFDRWGFWQNTVQIPDSGWDFGGLREAIAAVPGGGFLVGSYGWHHVNMVRVDAELRELWRVQSSPWSWIAYGIDVEPLPDGGAVLAGSLDFVWDHVDFYMARVDSVGDTLWTRTYDSGEDDYCEAVAVMPDGGFVLAGWRQPVANPSWQDMFLVRTDAHGDTLWTRVFGDADTTYGAFDVQVTADGGLLACGLVRFGPTPGLSDYFLMKLTAAGEQEWVGVYGTERIEQVPHLGGTLETGLVIGGWTQTGANGWDYLVYRLAAQDVAAPEPPVLLPEFQLLQNYPNPFNATTVIEYDLPHEIPVRLTLYNLLGQEVKRLSDGRQGAGRHRVTVDARDLSSGVYLYRLESGSRAVTRKLLLVR